MIKLGIISDTHDLLREEVLTNLEDCDYILHAGDITNKDILTTLETYAPTIAVRGNNDTSLVSLPLFRRLTFEKVNIYMTHQKKDIPEELDDISIIIYGHSHKYDTFMKEGRQYLNPGSCGRKRFSLAITMAYLYIDEDNYRIERMDIKE